MVKILLTGATGYIGSSVLSALVDHPERSTFEITTLVRDAQKGEKLKQFGVNVVIGSHLDGPLFEKLCSETDALIACADADHPEACQSALNGLKKRFEATGVAPIFIHTSGTGVLADNAMGRSAGTLIWHDDDPKQIATLEPTALHRDIEVMVTEADKAGYVRSYIISPPTIWGLPTHTVSKTGITHRHSFQVPMLIRASIAHGNGIIINEGKNIWDNVNVDELGLLYSAVLVKALKQPNVGHGLEGMYFARADEYVWADLSKAVAQALFDLGKGRSPVPEKLNDEEATKTFSFVARFLACNARCTARHSLSTGWNPKKTTKDMMAYVRPEVEAILAGEK
ncbi:hypothetical protein AMATHDRAFT_8404 [Amanita thiersii Skay4041]|uniref:NmrA-like domain-containing protein n=1 Tax=Amanita thiersii Skay4041 TaxID=703135 RepID=A0A2A9NDY6_9AGAR|nr:hypothetical protein AMATHDRAFT_8404 [Amanita thiersii Skay4041]